MLFIRYLLLNDKIMKQFKVLSKLAYANYFNFMYIYFYQKIVFSLAWDAVCLTD